MVPEIGDGDPIWCRGYGRNHTAKGKWPTAEGIWMPIPPGLSRCWGQGLPIELDVLRNFRLHWEKNMFIQSFHFSANISQCYDLWLLLSHNVMTSKHVKLSNMLCPLNMYQIILVYWYQLFTSPVQSMKQYKCLDEESEMDSEESEIKFLFDAVDDGSSSSSSSSDSSSSDKKARGHWNMSKRQSLRMMNHFHVKFISQAKKRKGKKKGKKDKMDSKKNSKKSKGRILKKTWYWSLVNCRYRYSICSCALWSRVKYIII